MKRLLILFVALLSVPAFAEPSVCDTPIDLRNPGESMEGLPPTTQGYGPTNLCGFFTFSNYLDSYRISRNSERGATQIRSSPVAIGVENAIRRNIPFWFPIQNSTDPLDNRFGRWGSTFCALAKSVKDIGYCADDSLPTRTTDETAKFSDVATFFYHDLVKISDTPAPFRRKSIAAKIGPLYAKYLEWAGERKSINFNQGQMLAIITANVAHPYESIRAIFFPKCAEATHRHQDLKFSACKGELFVGLDLLGIPTRDQDPLRTERAQKRVVELLSRPHALPVPFAYCSGVLKEGKRYEGMSAASEKCGIHWSLIAGRRRIGPDCFLLVHNSWKPDATYSKDWMVDGTDIWVREKELSRAMLMVQWLEE
jgi:hypothetical protein